MIIVIAFLIEISPFTLCRAVSLRGQQRSDGVLIRETRPIGQIDRPDVQLGFGHVQNEYGPPKTRSEAIGFGGTFIKEAFIGVLLPRSNSAPGHAGRALFFVV